MSFLRGIGVVYGFGMVLVMALSMRIFVGYLIDQPTKKTIRLLPKFVIGIVLYMVAWPALVFIDQNFRKIVVDVGRIGIIFGYLACALMTFVYPWIWAWFIGMVATWFFLERLDRGNISKTG